MARRRRLLALQLVLWPSLLALAELGYRGWCAARGEPYRRAAVEAEIGRIVSSMTRDVPDAGPGESLDTREPLEGTGGKVPAILHPYFGFGPRTILEKVQRELRRYGEPPEGDERRVLLLGGSVAGNFGRKGRDALERALRAQPGLEALELTLLNYGLGAHKEPQQLTLCAYLLSQGLEIDAVLNLDGFNEVALASYNGEHGAHPSYPSLSHWGHLARPAASDPELAGAVERVLEAQASASEVAERAERLGLSWSALLGHFALAEVRSEHRSYARAFEAYTERLAGLEAAESARGPGFDADPGAVLALAVDTWARSSRLLADLCRARGLGYLHVLQPTLHDEGSKPLTSEERASAAAHESWIEGARRGYPLLRARGEKLAAAGVPFLDASGVFKEVAETLYYDACHFHAPGHARLARAVAPALAAVLLGGGS